MDDRFLCPDCHALHDEPLDAALGHVSRCLTCTIVAEPVSTEVPLPLAA